MVVRLKRQLYLLGERVFRPPPRLVAGAPRPVLRVSVSAVHEDLVTIEGVGPFSALSGTLDFVDVPIELMKQVRSAIALPRTDGDRPTTFHVNFYVPPGFAPSVDTWSVPIEIFLTLEPPTDPRIDPTDPWTWDVTRQPELAVLSISMHPLRMVVVARKSASGTVAGARNRRNVRERAAGVPRRKRSHER